MQKRLDFHYRLSDTAEQPAWPFVMLKTVFPLLSIVSCLLCQGEEVLIPIGTYEGSIVPEQMRPFTLPEKGTVTNLIDPEGRIAKGTVFAKINDEQLKQEKEDMETRLRTNKMTKRDDIRTMQKQKRDIEFYFSLPEEERKMAPKPTGADNKDIIKDTDERIALAEKNLETSERIERETYDKKLDKYVMKMPFDGRLQYSFPLPKDLDAPMEMEMLPTQPQFATAYDDSAFYITCPITNAEITQLDGKRICARITLSEGKLLKGEFDRKQVSSSGGSASNTSILYFFKLSPEDNERAYDMIASRPRVTLYYKSDGNDTVVSRLELARRPEASTAFSWENLVERVYPQYNIVLIAEKSIILRPK